MLSWFLFVRPHFLNNDKIDSVFYVLIFTIYKTIHFIIYRLFGIHIPSSTAIVKWLLLIYVYQVCDSWTATCKKSGTSIVK